MSLRTALTRLHKRPIAYYEAYAGIMGSISGGVILSQVLYWWGAVDGRKFHKTDEEIRKETRATERELRDAKLRMKRLPFLKITRAGLPAKTWYEVDETLLVEALSAVSSSDDVDLTSSDDAVPTGLNDGVRTFYSENTTEITTESMRAVSAQKEVVSEKKLDPTLFHSPDQLIDFYNTFKPDECPKVENLTEARKKKYAAYIKQFPRINYWDHALAEMGMSQFLRGLKESKGHTAIARGLDWLCQKGQFDGIENCQKVYEGKYNDKHDKPQNEVDLSEYEENGARPYYKDNF